MHAPEEPDDTQVLVYVASRGRVTDIGEHAPMLRVIFRFPKAKRHSGGIDHRSRALTANETKPPSRLSAELRLP